MTTNTDGSMNDKYDKIRDALHSQCTKEDFLSLKCPVCGGDLILRVNLDGKRFFVRCTDDSTHLAMHGKNESPPTWFEEMPRTGWYGAS
jgi:hypothetical protein